MYLPRPPFGSTSSLISVVYARISVSTFSAAHEKWLAKKTTTTANNTKKLAIHVGEILGITLLLLLVLLLLLCVLAWPALIVCPVRGLAKYARVVYNFRCQTFFANTSELSCYRCCCSCCCCLLLYLRRCHGVNAWPDELTIGGSEGPSFVLAFPAFLHS